MTISGNAKLKIWLVLVVVFALGSITGAALTGLYRSRASNDRPPEKEKAGRGLEKIRGELNLTDEQTKSVSAILDDTRNEYRALRAELRPRFDAPRQKARARIREVLTPEQRQKFDAIVAQKDAQREQEQKNKH
jgi:Spy/CpxP family protein refolding chaperone